jgi:hypothetical protein
MKKSEKLFFSSPDVSRWWRRKRDKEKPSFFCFACFSRFLAVGYVF